MKNKWNTNKSFTVCVFNEDLKVKEISDYIVEKQLNWVGGSIPNDKNSLLFKIPSIWALQILFWILGVGMMWFLAYKMEMSTETKEKIEQLNDFH